MADEEQGKPEEDQVESAAAESQTADEEVATESPEEPFSAPDEEPEITKEDVDVKVPDFAPLAEKKATREAGPMDRFYDVQVPVWAELGRIKMPLGEIMKLDEGSVLRLDRAVSEPVELESQGVTLARGEVVVIDDCFAVRIKEIESSAQ